jgi:hypothetical protein
LLSREWAWREEERAEVKGGERGGVLVARAMTEATAVEVREAGEAGTESSSSDTECRGGWIEVG